MFQTKTYTLFQQNASKAMYAVELPDIYACIKGVIFCN